MSLLFDTVLNPRLMQFTIQSFLCQFRKRVVSFGKTALFSDLDIHIRKIFQKSYKIDP